MISYAYGRFGKHLENRQIPYQSVRGPLGFVIISTRENTRLIARDPFNLQGS